ncbi:MAG: glycoside hydrolase family 3 C-terminal domain-containing protein [Acidimicrobiales bacterium]
MSPQDPAARRHTSDEVNHLVSQMTLEEKCTMVRGDSAWVVQGCERLGIPDWTLSDGPVGARGRGTGPGLVVPGPSAISATWDTALVEEVGVALGVEGNDRRIDVLLAPTVNLHRSPRGGRHFESYSEDPELSSRIAVAYIRGVQSQGVGACVKHFVANDQEFERFTIDVDVDERSLREIYLPPFEAAVKEAGVASVMGAYNYVNGDHACAHPDLLVDVLKDEWGFDGFVVSDWGAIKETVAPARHGLDLEMPGPGRWWGGGRLQAAVEAGEVDEASIDDKVRRIVSFLKWRGRLGAETDHEERSVDRPEHRELVRGAAAAGMVLVKNAPGLDGEAVLPLAGSGTIALIGPGVASTAMLGGGSANLTAHRTTNVLDSMTERLGDRLVGWAPGLDMRRKAAPVPPEWMGEGGVTFELYDGIGFDGEIFETVTRARAFGVWVGDSWPKGHDTMSVRMTFEMTPNQSGRHRACALGFAHSRLFVDDVLVADNAVEPFSGGLGQHGGTGTIDLEAGRTYRMRLEHVPRGPGQWICVVDVGVELADDDREQGIADAVALAARAETAVVVVGSNNEWESEGGDRESIELPNGQDDLVRAVVAANPNTVVVLNCGAPMTLPWLDDVPAVLLAWYPGQEAGDAIADVLVGDAEPGGRMPTTWARDERDTPAYVNYPGEAGVVRYGEGIFVGYRWYDTRGIEPLIPFGHGGSYTTFEWGAPKVAGDGVDLVVTVPVTNTGERTGSDVVQIYVSPTEHVVPRPEKELAGFAKVHLVPGATGTATVRLSERSFARWDAGVHAWVVDPGRYIVVVAASATDIRSTVEVVVPDPS